MPEDTVAEPAPQMPAADNPATLNAEVYSPEYRERRRQSLLLRDQAIGFTGIDHFSPTGPSGHAYGIHTSTQLTSYFRQTHRKGAMDITPQQVIDVLNSAGVKKWVLMGLHGYVGYMAEPRATQDVDVMVPYSQRARATKAIRARWPGLQTAELSQVTRFLDPGDLTAESKPKAVLDLMLPWMPFQEEILKKHVLVDDATQHHLPTLEAALVSKYAAIISPYRNLEKKDYDAGDFRRIVRASHALIRMDILLELAALVYEHGPRDIEAMVQAALSNTPFTL